ncbi:MAG: hypothetical protein RL038_760 [Actinomycetota bacterium]|jgi:methylenetetrahydrofolate reductase (NADPH)
MTIAARINAKRAIAEPVFSAEFFPPKSVEAEETLWQTIAELQTFELDFVSVTYGAGGSTQERSLKVLQRIIDEYGLRALAHLTCVSKTAAELSDTISEFVGIGVTDILALRGDPVAGIDAAWVTTPGGYQYAVELVNAIKGRGGLGIAVAAFPEGHPESPNMDQDVQVLLAKQNAGAEFAITNLFFEADRYFQLVQAAEAAGVTIPILPGLMPVTNLNQIARFALMSGADFPTALKTQYEACSDETEVRELGVQHTVDLARQLLAGGAPGIHVYTLNRWNSALAVFSELGVARRS